MANPKNPVRAARQAGRQLVKAAKQERRDVRQEKKAAQVATKFANKVAKINSKTDAKTTSSTGSTGSEAMTPMTGKGIKPIAGAPKQLAIKSVARPLVPASKSSSTTKKKSGTTTKKKESTTTKQPNITLSEYAELQKQYERKTRYLQDTVEKLKKQKDAERQESIKKLLPSSYMKKNGGSVKKYQKGGATKPIIAKPTIVGKKNAGPRPALAPIYQTPKQKAERRLDNQTVFSTFQSAPKGSMMKRVKSIASKTKKNK